MESGELAHLVDAYCFAREDRLAADKVAKDLKTKESQLKAQILEVFKEDGMGAAGGESFAVKLKSTPKPVAKDWGQIYEYITSTKDISILQRRLHETHIKDCEEAGITIPGVDWFPVDDLTISKLK